MSVAGFLYNTAFRPRPLRVFANKMICAIVPKVIRLGDVKVVINPRDPVISGSLAFGVYEKSEIAFMQRVCKPGHVMIDVGANVGLYTAIAGVALGPTGRIIALEPDPESFQFLEQTVHANGLTNAQTIQAAASDLNGTAKLYICSENRGDNRLYQNGFAERAIDISVLRLDDYLAAEGVNTVDIVKIDVQGFEGHVIAGLEQTILRSPRLIMLMELCPCDLRAAGTPPLALLQRITRLGLTLYGLKARGRVFRIQDPNKLVNRLHGRQHTNIVAIRE